MSSALCPTPCWWEVFYSGQNSHSTNLYYFIIQQRGGVQQIGPQIKLNSQIGICAMKKQNDPIWGEEVRKKFIWARHVSWDLRMCRRWTGKAGGGQCAWWGELSRGGHVCEIPEERQILVCSRPWEPASVAGVDTGRKGGQLPLMDKECWLSRVSS